MIFTRFFPLVLACALPLSVVGAPAATGPTRQPPRIFSAHETERGNARTRLVREKNEDQALVALDAPFNPEEILVIEALVGGPLNNNFADATVIVTPAGDYPGSPISGDNIDATKEVGEPNHGGNAGGKSAWWKWTAPSNLRVSLYSVNSDFETVLGVYTGSAVNALTAVPADPFTVPVPEAHFFPATAGTTYSIAVDGLDGRSGNITLNLATLAATTPTITTQPTGATLQAGQYFLAWTQVTAGGSGPLFYQWYHEDVALPTATSASLHILNIGAAQAGRYHVVVRNYWGFVTSNPVILTVTPSPTAPPPIINTQPANVSLTAGEQAIFTVTATGSGSLTYQWFFNGNLIQGAMAPLLNVPNAQTNNAGSYTVTVSNAGGSVTSAVAELRVLPAATKPVITGQPTSRTVTAGSNVTFTVVASGSSEISYQWLRADTPIANATSASLTLNNVQSADASTYSVNVINALGTTQSSNVTLTVTTPAPPPSSSGGGGGGGAPSIWLLGALACLVAARARWRPNFLKLSPRARRTLAS